MFAATLYPKTKQVLEQLAQLSFVNEFYLAGGTALALQLGHRRSVDLDFFTMDFDADLILQALKHQPFSLTHQAEGTLDLLIAEVKVSFLQYNYRLLAELKAYQGLKLAAIEDIACMKLTAISSRGSKKDFVDLYFILKQINFNDLLNLFKQKYQGIDYNLAHILKSLSYFADADADPEVDYLQEIDWESVKREIAATVSVYLAKSVK